MRYILILILSVLAYASEADAILKKIPQNSPEYSYDKILVQKIDTLKFTKPSISFSLKNNSEILNSFYRLNASISEYEQLPSLIEELNSKISVLNNSEDPTSKLQKIYYEKLLSVYEQKHAFYKENLQNIEENFLKKLNSTVINTDSARKDLSYYKNLLQENSKKYEKLKIELQKWQLLNNEKNIKQTNALIAKNISEKKRIYKHLLDSTVLIWLDELKKKDKKAFDTDDDILKYSKFISPELYNSLNQTVTDLEHIIFGAKVIVYSTKKEAQLIWQKFLNFINYPLFNVGNRTITPLNFAILILVIVLGWFIGKYYKYFIYRLRHKYNISHSTATLLANMGYYTIITLSFLTALKVVGLDLSSLAIIAGALSVGIGFGLQNIISNFVSGIILMFERSIKVGDYIQIDENTRGEVVDISMRSTVIRTNDNINLIIPNQSFIQNNVINWTLGDDIVRFRVPFGVAYGSDIDRVEKCILTALENSDLPIIRKYNGLDVTPYVVFMEMGESSLNFELFIWVKGEYARRPRRTRSAFLKMIYNALNKEGINIPFPQQDLHIKESVPFEITIKR